ncbi:MAG: zinc finger domain-containing protein [Pseudonocardiaceae bacterium]
MNDLRFAKIHELALAHPEPCGYCHAATGTSCVNKKTGKPFQHLPAHFARLNAADLVKAWHNE